MAHAKETILVSRQCFVIHRHLNNSVNPFRLIAGDSLHSVEKAGSISSILFEKSRRDG
jgi:hypothetical protein